MSFHERLVVTLARESENLLPSDFYDVRQEIKPKAGWLPMYVLAGIAYIGCIMAFILMFISESHKSYVDTQIFSYDNSGNDGYSCQMISKVTASYEIPSNTDPAMAYQLVNVIESKSDFEEDMRTADPCSHQLLYFPGTAEAPFDGVSATYGGVAFYKSEMAFVMTTLYAPMIMFYNYTYGTYDLYEPVSGTLVNAVAIGRTERFSVVYLRSTGIEGAFEMYEVEVRSSGYFYENMVTQFTMLLPSSEFQPRVLNDNHYNIYVMGNDTIYSVNIYGELLPPLEPLYTLQSGAAFHRAAVHNDTHGGGVKVYYVDSTMSCYVWSQLRDSVTNLHCLPSTVDVVVDGADEHFFLQNMGDNVYAMVNNQTSVVGDVTSAGPPAGFAITPAGDRALATITGLPTTSDQLAFMFHPHEALHDLETSTVQAMTGFGAGFYTCADQLLDLSDYSPGEVSSYPQACRTNGVVGEVVFAQKYLFTNSDASTYALQHAPSHCTDLYPVIADTISDLPPYSCSRNVHPSFLACFATAAANTQLIFQVVVFFSAILLTRLAPRFPPKETVYRGAAPPAATPMAVEMTTVIDKCAGNGNVGHDIENPMTR